MTLNDSLEDTVTVRLGQRQDAVLSGDRHELVVVALGASEGNVEEELNVTTELLLAEVLNDLDEALE